jgi:hypothetical protein
MKTVTPMECDNDCNCMNCRLRRMELDVDKMQKMVEKLREHGAAMRGMPAERNRLRK